MPGLMLSKKKVFILNHNALWQKKWSRWNIWAYGKLSFHWFYFIQVCFVFFLKWVPIFYPLSCTKWRCAAAQENKCLYDNLHAPMWIRVKTDFVVIVSWQEKWIYMDGNKYVCSHPPKKYECPHCPAMVMSRSMTPKKSLLRGTL